MKKILSMILALAMLFSLAVPAMAVEITGDSNTDKPDEGNVTATFAPEIYLSGISITGDTVTYDPETNTYTAVFPVGAEGITYYTVLSGKNLAYYRDAADRIWFREVGFRNGEQVGQWDNILSDYNYFTYDEATGNLTMTAQPVAASAGQTWVRSYSNDGGRTWQEAYTLVFAQAYSITNSTAADANGSVTVPASAIEGETVNLTVTPDEGYELDALTVTNTATGAAVTVNEDHTFTMPAGNVTVTATFQQATKTYTVTVDENIANGTVVVNPTTYTAGQTVALAVTPADGYVLDQLTVTNTATGEPVNVHEDYSFTMPEGDVTVTAVFEALTAEITGMSIIIDGVEYNSANTSETNPAVITPATQSLIVKVTGENLQYNKTAIVSYSPTVNADNVHADYGWNISQEGDTATRDALWLLEILSKTETWQLQYANDGNTLQSSGVYVAYQVPTYAVNISTAVANGTVTVTPNPAEEGQTVTVTVEPVAGYAYVVGSLQVINEATGLEVPVDEASKTFTMPDSTVMVSAEFEELTVTSADISWGSLSFTYTDGEDGAEGAWSNDGTDGAGTVTVKNTGDNTFTTQPVYTAEADYDEIECKFYNSAAPETPSTMGFTLDSDEAVTIILKLFNKPEKAIPAGTKIGTVTITIQEGAPE